MASIFMRIRGLNDIKGASQIAGDAQLNNGGSAVTIDGFEWSVGREINMDVGNGSNSDTSKMELSNMVITKKVNGISPSLLTLLFKPTKGRVIDIIYGLPSSDGKGVRQQHVFTLDGAKICDYQIDTETGEDGSVPTEKVVISFTSFVSQFTPTGIAGAFGDPSTDMVVYDVPTGTLQAGTEIK